MATEPLIGFYDALVCDLDGVVYRGMAAVPGAVATLNGIDIPVVYATNNASRPPHEVAEHLVRLGVSGAVGMVVNSSMAGAAELASTLESGARVLAVGGHGVTDALDAAGLCAVRDAREPVAAVLQGYGPRVTAADLAEAAYAIQAGARWVATNTDATLPTDRGLAPGNGSLVECVRAATGADPFVVGKPHAPLYVMGADLVGIAPERILAVGDRLDTDIAGAHAAGMDSVLVLTGAHGARDAAVAEPGERPTYVVTDLTAVLRPYAEPTPIGPGFRCGTSEVALVDGRLSITIDGAVDIATLRAALAVIWAARDHGLSAEGARAAAAQLPDRV